MNNKPKEKQQKQQPQAQRQPKKGGAVKVQRQQPKTLEDSSPSSSSSSTNNKPKDTVRVANKNPIGPKNDPDLSELSKSLKRLNYSNKKASKGSGSQQHYSNKRNQYNSSGSSRMKSRDEDHKNDPMGHKKNHFGKMRLTEFLNSDQGNVASTSTGEAATKTKASLPSELSAKTPCAKCSTPAGYTNYNLIGPMIFTGKQFQKKNSKYSNSKGSHNNNQRNEPRNVIMNSTFVPIVQPKKPILSSSNIAAVIADTDRFTIFEKMGKLRTSYPIMQVCLS